MLVEIICRKKILFLVYIGEKRYWEGCIMKRMGCTVVPWWTTVHPTYSSRMISIWGNDFNSQLHLFRETDGLTCDARIRALGIHHCCWYFTWSDFYSGSYGLRYTGKITSDVSSILGSSLSNTNNFSPYTKSWQEDLSLWPLCCLVQVRWYVWHCSIWIHNVRKKQRA